MKKRFESRGEKSKDAAMDTPIKDKDAGKEYVEEEDVSRIAMIERESEVPCQRGQDLEEPRRGFLTS